MVIVREQIESFRYVNHLWPMLFLRLYVGYFFVSSALEKVDAGYLNQPVLSAAIDELLFSRGQDLPAWVSGFYLNYVQDNWLLFSEIFVYLEWGVGLLLMIGFLTRPMSLVSLVYLFGTSYIMSGVVLARSSEIMIMLAVLLIFGAGRVCGVDYFFYKRKRGLIW